MSKKIFARTVPKTKDVFLTWKIEKFSELHLDPKTSLHGPTFSLPTNPESSWQSYLTTNATRASKQVLYFTAQPLTFSSPISSQINFEVSIITSDQSESKVKVNSFIILKSVKDCIWSCLGYFSEFEEKKHLENNVLTLECRFSVVRWSTKEEVDTEKLHTESSNCLSNSFKALYSSKKFSDFTIVVGKEQFPVHKSVLSCRSSVFAAMFENETLETSTNKLEIKDLDVKTVEIIILYLYTGQVEDLSSKMYLRVYSAADKYHITSLKKLCTRKLVRNIAIDNVCDVFAIGYYHNDLTLKTVARKYVNRNIHVVLRSKNWQKIVSENNLLATDLLRNAVV